MFRFFRFGFGMEMDVEAKVEMEMDAEMEVGGTHHCVTIELEHICKMEGGGSRTVASES